MSEHNAHEHDYDLRERDRRLVGLGRTRRGSGASRQRWTSEQRREMARTLRAYPLFSRCDDADLEALIGHASPFTLPANWPMVLESTPADACYVITDGTATVYRGRETVAALSAGDVVGEMAALTGSLRRATVTTSSRVSGLRIANADLTRLLGERRPLLDAMRKEFEVRTTSAGRSYRPAPLPAMA